MMLVVALLAFGCSSDDEKQRSGQPARETTGERSEPPEETTAPRETTEVTTGFEFEVGRTPMDEDDDAGRRRSRAAPEATPREAPPIREEAQPEPQPADEEDAPPEPAESAIECRFFTQSEFVNADPEQKAFIRECDRAAGRAAPSASPVQQERDAKEDPPPQPPPVPSPEPQVAPQPVPAPQPSGGRLTCDDFASPAEAQAALPANPRLDGDNDGQACE